VILPFTPLAATLGLVPLPGSYFVFLGGVTMTYLALVEVVRRRLIRTLLDMGPRNTCDEVGHAGIVGPLMGRKGRSWRA
jgi:hypothetical protein